MAGFAAVKICFVSSRKHHAGELSRTRCLLLILSGLRVQLETLSTIMLHLFMLFVSLCLADPSPQVIPWNTKKSYGPDGPWQVFLLLLLFVTSVDLIIRQAVSVGLGTDKSGQTVSTVDLHPGGFSYHIVYGSDYCTQASNQGAPCAAQDAGLFDSSNSVTLNDTVTNNGGIAWAQGSDLARKTTAKDVGIALDRVVLNSTQGSLEVNNSAVDIVHDEAYTLPDGSTYAPQVGVLAIGSLEKYRKYPRGLGAIFPNGLASQNITPSASTSLHYGSASLGPVGSLVFGGYDQNRVIGNAGKYPIAKEDSRMDLNLVDIALGVETGGSPFEAPSIPGLMEHNDTFGSYRPATINPILPYFFMSPETCNNIAKHLPVTLQPPLGLYTWNTADPQYARIVNSPSYLAFVFRSGSASSNSNTADARLNTTIKVPFKLLNLTLEAPIVSKPEQYFPCYPYTASDGRYYLGRAFLQAAFVALNFNSTNFFLAQAPGPDADPPNIQPIPPSDANLGSIASTAFGKSWEKHWTPLPANAPAQATSQPSSNRLSGGAIAGIVIGVIVAVLAIAALVAFILLRRRRQTKDAKAAELAEKKYSMSSSSPPRTGGMHEVDSGSAAAEIDGSVIGASEVDAGSPIFEAGGKKILLPERTPTPRAELDDDKVLPELPSHDSRHYGTG